MTAVAGMSYLAPDEHTDGSSREGHWLLVVAQ